MDLHAHAHGHAHAHVHVHAHALTQKRGGGCARHTVVWSAVLVVRFTSLLNVLPRRLLRAFCAAQSCHGPTGARKAVTPIPNSGLTAR